MSTPAVAQVAPSQTTPAGPTGAAPSPFASASLYVGDLNPDVAESQLFEIFNVVGPVASIRVCRDVATRRSLGYAYVNFHNVNDAERALDTMNNSPIKGRPCRIMWSQRDPSVRKSGVGNVFIKNLAKNIDHKGLFDTFSTFGNILSCKVAMDDQGRSRGYGFVHFETDDMANRAISRVNGMAIGGTKVFVAQFLPRKERLSNSPATKFTNIYVKNLDENIGSEQLKEIFGKFGKISSGVVMQANGKNRGFGFIDFDNHEEAAKAVAEMNGKALQEGGKSLFCGRAQKKSERESELKAKFEAWKLERAAKYQGVNLYIKNLDDDITDDKLREVFAGYGNITSWRIMRDEKGNSKGFGFVCFENPDEATRAANEMNGKMISHKPLYVALAQRKEVRRAQLEAQHAARVKGRHMGPISQAMYAPPAVFYPSQQAPIFYGQPIAPRGGHNRGYGPGYHMNQGAAAGYMLPLAQRAGPGQRNNVNQKVRPNNQRGNNNFPRGRDQPPAAPEAGIPLSQKLGSISADDHLNVVGEALFPLVEKRHREEAGKITGMLLDRYSSNFEELVAIMENPEVLGSKIQEAMDVLVHHKAEESK